MPGYSLPELKQMMKDNNIRGWSNKNKPEILKILNENGLVEDVALVQKEKKPVKNVLSEFELTKTIRWNPRKVVINDLDTGIETEYPSLYRAARTINFDAKTIARCNGKTLKNRYEIKMC